MAMYANVNGASKLLAQTSAEAGGGSWSLISYNTVDTDTQSISIAKPTGYNVLKYTFIIYSGQISGGTSDNFSIHINLNTYINAFAQLSGRRLETYYYYSTTFEYYKKHSLYSASDTNTNILYIDCGVRPEYIEFFVYKKLLFFRVYGERDIIHYIQPITNPTYVSNDPAYYIADLGSLISSIELKSIYQHIFAGSMYYIEGLK